MGHRRIIEVAVDFDGESWLAVSHETGGDSDKRTFYGMLIQASTDIHCGQPSFFTCKQLELWKDFLKKEVEWTKAEDLAKSTADSSNAEVSADGGKSSSKQTPNETLTDNQLSAAASRLTYGTPAEKFATENGGKNGNGWSAIRIPRSCDRPLRLRPAGSRVLCMKCRQPVESVSAGAAKRKMQMNERGAYTTLSSAKKVKVSAASTKLIPIEPRNFSSSGLLKSLSIPITRVPFHSTPTYQICVASKDEMPKNKSVSKICSVMSSMHGKKTESLNAVRVISQFQSSLSSADSNWSKMREAKTATVNVAKTPIQSVSAGRFSTASSLQPNQQQKGNRRPLFGFPDPVRKPAPPLLNFAHSQNPIGQSPRVTPVIADAGAASHFKRPSPMSGITVGEQKQIASLGRHSVASSKLVAIRPRPPDQARISGLQKLVPSPSKTILVSAVPTPTAQLAQGATTTTVVPKVASEETKLTLPKVKISLGPDGKVKSLMRQHDNGLIEEIGLSGGGKTRRGNRERKIKRRDWDEAGTEVKKKKEKVKNGQRYRQGDAEKQVKQEPVDEDFARMEEEQKIESVFSGPYEPPAEDNPLGFRVGDVVWAKMASEPWWPSEIFSFSLNGETCILWLGSNMHGWVQLKTLERFQDLFLRRYNPKRTARGYQKAVSEGILKLKQQGVEQTDWYAKKLSPQAWKYVQGKGSGKKRRGSAKKSKKSRSKAKPAAVEKSSEAKSDEMVASRESGRLKRRKTEEELGELAEESKAGDQVELSMTSSTSESVENSTLEMIPDMDLESSGSLQMEASSEFQSADADMPAACPNHSQEATSYSDSEDDDESKLVIDENPSREMSQSPDCSDSIPKETTEISQESDRTSAESGVEECRTRKVSSDQPLVNVVSEKEMNSAEKIERKGRPHEPGVSEEFFQAAISELEEMNQLCSSSAGASSSRSSVLTSKC